MQKIAFIWDLDGTLLDSYKLILSGIEETFAQFFLFLMIRKKSERVYPQVLCVGFAGAGSRREKSGCGSTQSGACPESG